MKANQFYITLLFVMTAGFTEHSNALSCGDAVTGNITLTENLHCTSGYVALAVFADNVTIDLNGYTISGAPNISAIRNVGYNALTVRNGSIKDLFVGVNTNLANNLTVNNVTFYEVGDGVVIVQGNKANIHDNDFIRTRGHGVKISNLGAKFSASENVVNNNEFYQAQFGIGICGDKADRNIITNNLLWKTVDFGIHLNTSDHNALRNNRVLESNSTALRLNNSSYNRIEGNSFRIGDRSGITILAKAGDSCLAGGSETSYKNIVRNNHSIGFGTGITLGLGSEKAANVFTNAISGNKLYDNNVGMFFNRDAHHNDGSGNAYQGTTTNIEDEGVGNIY